MGKESITGGSESRPAFEELDEWLRLRMQSLIQATLEEEVTEFLGRARSVRRAVAGEETGYRNGYGRPRNLTTTSGTVVVRRPRVRDTEERFVSKLLPLFQRRPGRSTP